MIQHRHEKRFSPGTGLLSVAIILLVAEFLLLLVVRSYLPCGIGPTAQFEYLPEQYRQSPFPVLHDEFTTDGLELRTLIEPEIVMPDTLVETSSALRNWTRNMAERGGVEVMSRDPRAIYEEFRNGAGGHCDPLAILYMSALVGFDLPAREVDLFAEPGNFNAAHTSVEVWIWDQWMVQDPTFNAFPMKEDGSPLAAWEVQEAYINGEEVLWIQDLDATDPKVEEYSVLPDELYGYIFYRLKRYHHSVPRHQQIMQRFLARLTGETECVLVTRYDFPLSEAVTDGTVDRYLLLSALLFLLIGGAVVIRETMLRRQMQDKNGDEMVESS